MDTEDLTLSVVMSSIFSIVEIFRQTHGMYIWHVALRLTLRDDKYTYYRLPKENLFSPAQKNCIVSKIFFKFFWHSFPLNGAFKGPPFYQVTDTGVYTSSSSFLDSNLIDRKERRILYNGLRDIKLDMLQFLLIFSARMVYQNSYCLSEIRINSYLLFLLLFQKLRG